MMFTSCAYPGCNHRIEYDPVVDAFRPRYCDFHMRHVAERTYDLKGATDKLADKVEDCEDRMLWIPVALQPVIYDKQTSLTEKKHV